MTRTFTPDSDVRLDTGAAATVVRHVPGRPELVVVSLLTEVPDDGMRRVEQLVPARSLALIREAGARA